MWLLVLAALVVLQAVVVVPTAAAAAAAAAASGVAGTSAAERATDAGNSSSASAASTLEAHTAAGGNAPSSLSSAGAGGADVPAATGGSADSDTRAGAGAAEQEPRATDTFLKKLRVVMNSAHAALTEDVPGDPAFAHGQHIGAWHECLVAASASSSSSTTSWAKCPRVDHLNDETVFTLSTSDMFGAFDDDDDVDVAHDDGDADDASAGHSWFDLGGGDDAGDQADADAADDERVINGEPEFKVLGGYEVDGKPGLEVRLDAASDLDVEEYGESVSVTYACRKPAASAAGGNNSTPFLVKMRLPVGDGQSAVEFAWVKECGRGTRPGLTLGWSDNEDDERVQPLDALEVPPWEGSTTLALELESGYGSQRFAPPTVTLSANNLDVDLREGFTAEGGVVYSGEMTYFRALYSCKTSGKAQVTVRVPVEPYDELVAHWTKDCGGGVADHLVVGTEPHRDDVVVGGRAQPRFRSEFLSKESSLSLDKKSSSVDFYLVADAPNAEYLIDRAAVTASKRHVVNAWLDGAGARKGFVFNAEAKPLTVHFACLDDGVSSIIVTVPLLGGYESVEFGFVKVCAKPVARRHRRAITANSALMLIVALAVAGAFLCYRCAAGTRRGAAGRRAYSAVARNGSGGLGAQQPTMNAREHKRLYAKATGAMQV